MADLPATGIIPQSNVHMDMHFGPRGEAVLAEMKSCHRNNLHAQVRRGVSQLFEYRCVYRDDLGDDVTLLLVLETRPIEEKAWLIGYAQSLGILIVWRDPTVERLVTTEPVPAVLDGIVTRI